VVETPVDTPVEIVPVVTPDPYVDRPGELSHTAYKPNHAVFLIDVSSSMNAPSRLPLLKESMLTLLSALRDVDKVSIITYAAGTQVLAEGVSCDRKEELAKIIKSLQADGKTEGRKAIEHAYRVAGAHYLTDGVNQIYLATDGDFRLGKTDEELYNLLQEKQKEGISLSVLGFGKKLEALAKMEKAAASGGGAYLHVQSANSQSALLEEVKRRARR
jgi:Ca-activated chloride channel family protein